jgi:YesN/AraC family two-component response regulator
MEGHKPVSILLVEDDEAAREILASVLAIKFPQTAFYFADNGKTGLNCFKKHHPAIVITDVNMPEMDGIQMVGEIKLIDADVKLIVLTAFSDKTILENSMAAKIEIDHRIMKPVDFGKLFKVIKQCLVELGPDHTLHPA